MTEGTEIEIVADPVPDAASLGIDLPDDPDEAVRVLLAEVHTARNEASAYLDDLRRVAADFDNFRKRAFRDQQGIVERATERLLEALLPVLDSFDAAVAYEPDGESDAKLMAGMRGTHTQLLDALAKEGLEPIPAWGEPFDPQLHEAVTSPADGEGDLVVSGELRRGYRLKGRVVRPALVALDYTG